MKIPESLHWLDSQRDVMIDTLQRWANINSGTLNLAGLARMRDELIQSFDQLDTPHEEIDLDPFCPVNDQGEVQELHLGTALRWRRRTEAEQRIFLCIHMDTVYDESHPFQGCRWIDDGTINGPGVADAKGGLLVMLFALLAFEQTDVASRIGWEVFINSDEEIGSPGSTNYFQEAATRHTFGLLFEPTLSDGTMVDQRRGSGNFSIVLRGQAAHAGREFEKGRNAIARLFQLGHQLHALNQQRSDVTVNLGRVLGGGPLNIVPDLAIVHVNARVDDAGAGQWLVEQIEQAIAGVNDEDGYTCELHGGMTSPPKHPDESIRLLQQRIEDCGKTLNQAIGWTRTGGTCDGNKLFAYGLPNIDTLGVRGGAIHSQDEFVLVDSLVERAKLVALLLTRFAEHRTIEQSYAS